MSQDTPKSRRGGARPGAGRPRKINTAADAHHELTAELDRLVARYTAAAAKIARALAVASLPKGAGP